jgi:hypothetical protein
MPTRRLAPPRRRAGRLGFVLLVAGLSIAAVAPGLTPALTTSLAVFTSSGAVAGAFSTDTLAPPTGLTAAGGEGVTLSWTPTVDTYATGYRVLRATTSGGPYTEVATVTPQSASTTTDDPSPGTYSYVLRSYYQAWTSVDSNEATVTVAVPGATTGFKACASEASDTGGDGDGYESNPARACADDSLFAIDFDSGITTNLSCTDPGQDRHRFWGFALGLPATTGSIDGIEVRADLALANNAGSSRLCAQLSWDGGATWTPAKSVPITIRNETTYVFGSASDTWGRDWAVDELSTTHLRVRLIDVSSRTDKDFRLDYVAVQVTYTP